MKVAPSSPAPTAKPVLPQEHFLPTLAKMLAAMKKQQNEGSTVKNLTKLLEDRIVSTLMDPAADKLRTSFADMLLSDDDHYCAFALQCLQKAVREMKWKPRTETYVFGHITNALHYSKHRDELAIQNAIEKLKPNGWNIPSRLKSTDRALAA